MARIPYVEKRFTAAHMAIITQADAICREYAGLGFTLTLRQLYYQFVRRNLLANVDTEYKRLGGIIVDARLAGLIDWDHVEDRTRWLRALSAWHTPDAMIRSAWQSYHRPLWEDQPEYVEVWIEKDALVGVIEGVCSRNDVPYFACRGYASISEVQTAAVRLGQMIRRGRAPTIIHLGDHDPSGIDMTRDIRDRLATFLGEARAASINRIALNMPQVQRYGPPPNPAKLTDSRAAGYRRKFGDDSWELDALEPPVIEALIEAEINKHRDDHLWRRALERQAVEKRFLEATYRNWREIAPIIEGHGWADARPGDPDYELPEWLNDLTGAAGAYLDDEGEAGLTENEIRDKLGLHLHPDALALAQKFNPAPGAPVDSRELHTDRTIGLDLAYALLEAMVADGLAERRGTHRTAGSTDYVYYALGSAPEIEIGEAEDDAEDAEEEDALDEGDTDGPE